MIGVNFKRVQIISVTLLLMLVCVLLPAQSGSRSSTLLSGVHITGGIVIDSTLKKGLANIEIQVSGNSDSAVLISNARGKLPNCRRINCNPDSLAVVCITPGYHVSKSKITVNEHGQTSDPSNALPWYTVEVTVYVAKD
jgi:hypothetical protein